MADNTVAELNLAPVLVEKNNKQNTQRRESYKKYFCYFYPISSRATIILLRHSSYVHDHHFIFAILSKLMSFQPKLLWTTKLEFWIPTYILFFLQPFFFFNGNLTYNCGDHIRQLMTSSKSTKQMLVGPNYHSLAKQIQSIR